MRTHFMLEPPDPNDGSEMIFKVCSLCQLFVLFIKPFLFTNILLRLLKTGEAILSCLR